MFAGTPLFWFTEYIVLQSAIVLVPEAVRWLHSAVLLPFHVLRPLLTVHLSIREMCLPALDIKSDLGVPRHVQFWTPVFVRCQSAQPVALA